MLQGKACMTRNQVTGARQRAIGHRDAGRALTQQRPQNTGGGTACAYQQQMATAQVKAGIALQVADQTGAIGVVAQDHAITKAQDVGCTGERRARADPIGQFGCVKLEGNGNVAAAPAFDSEGTHGYDKTIGRNQPFFIAQCLAGELGKTRMNPG